MSDIALLQVALPLLPLLQLWAELSAAPGRLAAGSEPNPTPAPMVRNEACFTYACTLSSQSVSIASYGPCQGWLFSPLRSHTAAGSWASLQTLVPAARGRAESRAAFHSGGPTATAGLWFPISHVGKGPINSRADKVIRFHAQRLNLPCLPLGFVGNL